MNLIPNLRIAAMMTLVTTFLLGIAYPLGVTAISRLTFPDQANGQLIERDGRVIGSRSIGQGFAPGAYFHSRPSAAGAGYDAANSGGTNLGPTNAALIAVVAANVAAARRDNPTAPVPVELVTASASGLDPHISPRAALFQVARVAQARGRSNDEIRALVLAHTEPRQWGFLGEPRVNVLLLNLALDDAGPGYPSTKR